VAESPVIYALTAKRAELSGLVLDLERQASRHRAELVHLDATLRLFAPDLVPATIRPRGKGHRSSLFTTGELSGFILDAMREASAPLSSRELAERLMVRKGMDVNDAQARKKVQTLIRNGLSAHKRRGTLASVGEGWDTRWKVAEPE
jgi:hypothetical protein